VIHQRLDLDTESPLVGFVVSKAVGGSVVRHRVTRRLRAQVAQRLDALPIGSGTVVRALPASGGASSAQLGAALDQALARLASAS
jgi:ribonuclease P protein component